MVIDGHTIEWVESHGDGNFIDYLRTPWSFEESVARLYALSGQVPKSPDREKVSVQFLGLFDGKPFSLYDYRDDFMIHIGGHVQEINIHTFTQVIVKAMSQLWPKPYHAIRYAAEPRYPEHGWDERTGAYDNDKQER